MSDERQDKIDAEIAAAPETPFHRLLEDFIQVVPTSFIQRYEKLVGRTAQQVKAAIEAKYPKTE
jgi:hypothetical protein